MSRWALVGSLCALTALSGIAAAQGDTGGDTGEPPASSSAEPDSPGLEVGVTALPGGDHVYYAESLPKGTVSTAFSAGFGVRSGLLASGHSMSRGSGTAALSYAVADIFSVGLVLDGYYDKHSGAGFEDHGFVGTPLLHLRVGKRSGTIAFGGELVLWVPGKDAPSVVFKATSIEARGLVSTRLGNGLRLAANVGFRLDNTVKSVDDQMALSVADQASLGVSEWNAVVAGVRFAYPTGKIVIGLDAELDAYIGKSKAASTDKPRPSLIIDAGLGYRLSPNLTAELFITSNIQEKPTVSAMGTIPLIPYGPLIAGGVQLQARFGGPKRATGGGLTGPVKTTCDDPDPAKHPDDCPTTPPPPTLASVAGEVTDDTGAPVKDAKVTITDCKGKVITTATDDTGHYTATDLEPCEATVVVEAPNRLTQTAKVTLTAGDNTAPTTPLPPAVKPGTFRFVIHSFATGKGVPADIEINPGALKVSVAADGSTKLDIPPGTYTLKITSPGLKDQTREYVVTENNVVFVNVDLRK